MAKTKEDAPVEETAEAVVPETGRTARWKAFLQAAEKQNPEKFAAKKAKGEFDKIPENFA